MNENLEHALKYAESGYHVFPLSPNSKIPNKETHGFYDATTDKEKILKWWENDPKANIGVRCGQGFKILALDIDRKDGKNGFLWLGGQDDLPDTIRLTTPSGGEQVFFVMPEEYLKSSADEIAVGVDIRADSGYTIFPPSFIKKTNKYKYEGRYEWVTDQGFNEIALAKAPEWLLNKIRETTNVKFEKEICESELILPILDVLKKYGVKLQQLKSGVCYGSHPKHGSSNGMNFRVDPNKNIWACYRHRDADGTFVGGGSISLVAMLEGIIGCEDCVPKGLVGDNFKKTLNIIEEKFGIPLEKFSDISTEAIMTDINNLKNEKDKWKFTEGIKDINKKINKLGKAENLQIVSYAKSHLGLSREELSLLKVKRREQKTKITLDMNEDGKTLSTDKNLLKIFNNDSELKNCFKKNLFSGDIDIVEIGKWCVAEKKVPRQLNNMDTYQIKKYVIDTYDIEYKKMSVDEAIISFSIANSYDPLLDYLNSLEWDGVSRLETWMKDYMGVEDNLYSRYVSRLLLVAAVKRAYEPGCQYDHVVVFSGEQGLFKSSVIGILGGEWYESLSLHDKDKETIQKMQGKWFLELGEGTPFRKKEITEFKNFITNKQQKERFAYERHMETYKRKSVFVMTINPQSIGYLNDETGNRRFLPVRITRSADIKTITEKRDQLFAEAISLYKEGFKIFIDENNKDIMEGLEKEHRIAEVKDDWYEKIFIWITRGYSVVHSKKYYKDNDEEMIEIPVQVSCGYIWEHCFGGDLKNYKQQVEGIRIGKILKKLGCEYVDRREGNRIIGGYDLSELLNKPKEEQIENKEVAKSWKE